MMMMNMHWKLETWRWFFPNFMSSSRAGYQCDSLTKSLMNASERRKVQVNETKHCRHLKQMKRRWDRVTNTNILHMDSGGIIIWNNMMRDDDKERKKMVTKMPDEVQNLLTHLWHREHWKYFLSHTQLRHLLQLWNFPSHLLPGQSGASVEFWRKSLNLSLRELERCLQPVF